MTSLFEPAAIGKMILKNRMVRSATWEGMCYPDGRPTDKLIQYYSRLASGGVGLIITGYTYVCREGKQNPGKMGLYNDSFGSEYQKMTQAVHDAGGRIAMQLVHAGGQARSQYSGKTPVAPSGIRTIQFPEKPLELTQEQIRDIVRSFGIAALKAKYYGFDAVQIHGAHGYLVNQFLSPLTNQRKDQYGGSLENRSRFLMEVYDEIREKTGSDFPVCIKMNAADHLDGGLEPEDAVTVAEWLSQKGINAIEVSAGTGASGKKNPARSKIDAPEKEAYNLSFAQRIKEAVSCPVMVVGGFRSIDISIKAVDMDKMDFICFSRPLIREPDLPFKWQKGDVKQAACISCNGCFKPGLLKGGIFCIAEHKKRKE